MAKLTCQLWNIRMELKAQRAQKAQKARRARRDCKIEMSTFCPQSSTLLSADF